MKLIAFFILSLTGVVCFAQASSKGCVSFDPITRKSSVASGTTFLKRGKELTVQLTRPPSTGVVVVVEFTSGTSSKKRTLSGTEMTATFYPLVDGTLNISLDGADDDPESIPIRVARPFETRNDLGAGLVTSHLADMTGFSLARALDANGVPRSDPSGEPINIVTGSKKTWFFDTSFSAGISFLFDEDVSTNRRDPMLLALEFLSLSLYDPGGNRMGLSTGTILRGDSPPAYYFGISLFGDRDGSVGFSYGLMFQSSSKLKNLTLGQEVVGSPTFEVETNFKPTFFIGYFVKSDMFGAK